MSYPLNPKVEALINLINEKRPTIKACYINSTSLSSLHIKIDPPYLLTYSPEALYTCLTIKNPTTTLRLSINDNHPENLTYIDDTKYKDTVLIEINQ